MLVSQLADGSLQRDLPETALMKTLTWLRNRAQRQA
jgi:hypothetical protein